MEVIQRYADISRVDDEQRIVTGMAFVNERVDGDPYTLTRSCMEKATSGYLEWAAVREMHGNSAAGTALNVDWKDEGAEITVRVVDDMAWKKVKEGVYKGFSVGVRPKIVRGNVVTEADWIETSLVDRPKDPGAKFSVFRVEELERGIDSETPDLPIRENLEPKTHYMCGSAECCGHESAEEARSCSKAPYRAEIDGLMTRVSRLETEREAWATEKAELEAEIKRLADKPALQPVPMGIVRGAVERWREDDQDGEIKRLEEAARNEPDPQKRAALVAELLTASGRQRGAIFAHGGTL